MSKLRFCNMLKAKLFKATPGPYAHKISKRYLYSTYNFSRSIYRLTWMIPAFCGININPDFPRRFRRKRGEVASNLQEWFSQRGKALAYFLHCGAHVSPFRSQNLLELGPEAKGNWSGNQEDYEGKSPRETNFWCLSLGIECATNSYGAILGSAYSVRTSSEAPALGLGLLHHVML